jgi:hypothetical protein
MKFLIVQRDITSLNNSLAHYIKMGKVFTLHYTEIPKLIFTPYNGSVVSSLVRR